MSQKIGNYIHYYYRNYLNYGLGTRESPKNNKSAQQAYSEQKEYILQQVNQLTIKFNKGIAKQELEDRLNYFRPKYQIQESGNWSEEERRKIEQTIEKIVQDKIGSEFYIDFDTMQALNINSSTIQRVGGESLRKKISESGVNQIEAINKRLSILNTTLNVVYSKINTPYADELRKKLLDLEKQWQQILKTAPQYSKGILGQVVKHGNINFIKDLNTMWSAFKKEISSYATGIIGEYYAAVALQTGQLRGQEITEELLNNFITQIKNMSDFDLGIIGKQSSTRVYSTQNFAVTGKGQNHVLNNLFRDFSGGKFIIEPKQDKVDLQIMLQNLQPINASIKNYNFSPMSHLTVHSGSSILSLTQEYANFMNHYLNVTARTNGIQDYSQANIDLKPMNQVLRMTLALKAITGGILKLNENGEAGLSKQAEVLILNDNSGLYKVYWVDDLINKIINNINTYLDIEGLSDNTTWFQSWVVVKENTSRYQAAYARINKLISQLHAFKLKISLRPSIFSS